MKKFVLSTLAAGALAFGGAASAQDLGGVLSSIFGFGTPSYPVYNSGATPAVVAGTQSYGTVYVDQYGRVLNVDQYGRQVIAQSGPQATTGYDAWGRPIYGYGYEQDRDGDGVADIRDRWPNDRRYW